VDKDHFEEFKHIVWTTERVPDGLRL